MRYYEYYDIGDSYTTPTASVPANYLIPWIIIAPNAAGTSITISVGSSISTPGSYGGSIAGSGTFNDPDFVINTNTMPYTLNGLTPGSTYSIRLRAWSGAGQTGTYGEYIYDAFTMPKPSSIGGVTETYSSTTIPVNTSGTASATSGNRQVSRSLFTISKDPNAAKNEYSVAEKGTTIPTSYSHYAFGTGMFFPAAEKDVNNGGGIGFFVNDSGTDGYFVLVQQTANLASTADKEVKILKVINGKVVILNDSQDSKSNTASGILGGITYKIDIKVKIEQSGGLNYRTIDVFINNFKISAVDVDFLNTTDPKKLVLPVTNRIAMFASDGKAHFDYIYAMPLTEDQYKNNLFQNIYTGYFASPTLNLAFGEKILSGLTRSISQEAYFEEFGTVARELRRVKIKWSQPPAYPLYPSVGINKYVHILGSRLTSYGAEIYLINNAGTYVPLDDSEFYSFSVIGNYVTKAGGNEYTSGTISDMATLEPLTYESTWIQTESDAKNLTSWIKNQWSKQQQIINMSVFSNPLISVGDVITVNYPSNNLDGTQKFVVTNVNNSFSQGLETSITARSIYS